MNNNSSGTHTTAFSIFSAFLPHRIRTSLPRFFPRFSSASKARAHREASMGIGCPHARLSLFAKEHRPRDIAFHSRIRIPHPVFNSIMGPAVIYIPPSRQRHTMVDDLWIVVQQFPHRAAVMHVSTLKFNYHVGIVTLLLPLLLLCSY